MNIPFAMAVIPGTKVVQSKDSAADVFGSKDNAHIGDTPQPQRFSA